MNQKLFPPHKTPASLFAYRMRMSRNDAMSEVRRIRARNARNGALVTAGEILELHDQLGWARRFNHLMIDVLKAIN